MKKIYILLALVAAFAADAQGQLFKKKKRPHYIEISTGQGHCIIRLYDQTPLHRDNMLKLVSEGFYDGLLFHRVIGEFMIQGGDPDSRNAPAGAMLGAGEAPGPRIPAEFRDSLFHFKGVLAAARDNNPEKASSNCQFYLVQGKKYTEEELDQIESARPGGRKIPAYQRERYKTTGGAPFLDQEYTVFGEVVEGLDMVDRIATVKTDRNDRPLDDVAMHIRELKKREVRKLEKARRHAAR